MALEFKAVGGSGLVLPEDYLPTALPAMLRRVAPGYYPLIPEIAVSDGTESPELKSISSRDLASPDRTAKTIGGEPGWRLGPWMKTKVLPKVSFGPLTPGKPGTQTEAIVVIDAGIAFWNARFCKASGEDIVPRFADVGYVGFGATDADPQVVTFLGARNVQKMVSGAQGPVGEAALIEALGIRFPDSVFAMSPEAGRLYDPDGANHGTAVADLAGGAAPDVEGAPVLFGIEVPADAILDASGETLQAILPIALHAALGRVLAWWRSGNPQPNVRVVLPFAFLGGPDDGSHAAVRSMEEILNLYQDLMQVEICLPMGNHLQDRVHARLADLKAGARSQALKWFLQPGDYSPNTVEIVYDGSPDVTLALAAPDGDSGHALLTDGQVYFISKDGQKIGAVWAHTIPDGRTRLRLSLGPTETIQANDTRLSPGHWQIALGAEATAMRDICLYTLREDGSRYYRRPYPARRSYFRDTAYRIYDADGSFRQSDSVNCPIKRMGTASVLATGSGEGMINVAAQQAIGDLAARNAFYSGLSRNDALSVQKVLVDEVRRGRGVNAVGNGGPRLFRISGTSAAAALAARR